MHVQYSRPNCDSELVLLIKSCYKHVFNKQSLNYIGFTFIDCKSIVIYSFKRYYNLNYFVYNELEMQKPLPQLLET